VVIGVLIPDRRDRKDFLNHCILMVGNQTVYPDFIELVNYEPLSASVDLTQRVKYGFEILKTKGCDCVLIMENDDYYSKDYIKTLSENWENSGRPDIFGTDQTIYYHLGQRKYNVLKHSGRASLMNTLISCEAVFKFPADDLVYLDIYLWQNLKGKTFKPYNFLSLGIKHGVGLCGGNGHNSMNYKNDDKDLIFLKCIERESFNFYFKIAEQMQTKR
jgi:hypothetical protein